MDVDLNLVQPTSKLVYVDCSCPQPSQSPSKLTTQGLYARQDLSIQVRVDDGFKKNCRIARQFQSKLTVDQKTQIKARPFRSNLTIDLRLLM